MKGKSFLMANSESQLEFVQCSVEELREKLLQDLPVLVRLTATIQQFCAQKTEPIPLPCGSCTHAAKCKEPCDRLNVLLPGPSEGKGCRENLTGLYPDTLQENERMGSNNIFKQYELWEDDFTKHQWAVIELYYRECMTEEQIAKKLGKARSTVNGLLNRAKKRKEERDKQLRRETREQFKKSKE